MPEASNDTAPVTIAALPRDKLDLTAFTPPDAQLTLNGSDLVIAPPDPPPVVVAEFAAAAATVPPVPVAVADGVVIPADQMLAIVEGAGGDILVIDLIAEYLERLAPAAGPVEQSIVLSTSSHETLNPDDQASVRTSPDASFRPSPLPESVSAEGPDALIAGPAPITTPPLVPVPSPPSSSPPPPGPIPNASILAGPATPTTTLDTENVRPFGAFIIGHPDPTALLTIRVGLDDSATGTFTPASLAATGFVVAAPGIYQFTGTAAQAQAAIRQLAFNPTDNHTPLSAVDGSVFTVSADDGGIGTVTNGDTRVWATRATGTAANESATLPFPVSVGTVDLAGGTDTLRLADGGNMLAVRNVETLIGAAGTDVIAVAGTNTMAISGVETINGSGGSDALLMTNVLSGALVDLGGGTDVLRVATTGNNVIGVAGIETIAGSTADNVLTLTTNLTAGTTVTMDFGADVLNLAPGADTFRALNAETINGSTADDTLTFTGAITQATVNLGAGTDVLTLANTSNVLTASGAETITSGSGNDTLTVVDQDGVTIDLGAGSNDVVNVGGTHDVLSLAGVENITGTSASTVLTLTTNFNGQTINLGTGVDVLNLAAGGNSFRAMDAETIFGSTGNDTLSLTGAVDQATVDLGGGTDTLTLADTTNLVTVRGVETVTGGSGNDTVRILDATGNVNLGGGNSDRLDASALATINLDGAGTQYQGIEKLDLRGGVANTATLNVQDVLDLSPSTDTLLVRGSANDRVAIGAGWTQTGTQSNPQGESGTYSVYTQTIGSQTATLLVESQVPVS